MTTRCAWCGQPFAPDHRRRYCGPKCRREHGRYVECLPDWTARLAELERAAAGYRGQAPVFVRNEIRSLRDAIASRPEVTP